MIHKGPHLRFALGAAGPANYLNGGLIKCVRLHAGDRNDTEFVIGLPRPVGGRFLLFTLGLRDGGENVARLAGRRDKVNSAVAQSLKIFVPISQTRGHNDGNLARPSLREREKVMVSPVSQAALAENKAYILF